MKITGHMIVKNEDQWIWFAIKSTLPYLDKLFITDTGSTDNTLSIIKSFKSPKIIFKQNIIKSPTDLTAIRQQQLDDTKTDWFWIVDGDEIYPQKTAKEVVKATTANKYKLIVVKRLDLLGDIYHRQRQNVGQYSLFGQKGHLVSRLFNQNKIKGLHVKGDYPLEGYYTDNNTSTLSLSNEFAYITKNPLYHAMYLKRSGINPSSSNVFNRKGKYKIETGISITTPPPEVFFLDRPILVPDPLKKRSFQYELLASIISPVKNLKRLIA